MFVQFGRRPAGRFFFALLLGSLTIAACQQETSPAATAPIVSSPPPPAALAPTTRQSATPTVSPPAAAPPAATPTITPSPTQTPTPTATAPAAVVSGDPWAARYFTPVPDGLAPCGRVDLLDFPLDPPDGAAVSRGGADFARFRSSVDKFHAGEDWWLSGNASFGAPVYAIGHGLVTYAEPEGWGRDKGVVIVQHIFADGSSFLSLYGHLDPPSVTLTPGQCVARGDQVGRIGRPRGSPHLHFEIRTQAPYQTLTGYWPEDPTTAGWLPPSATIWENRLAGAPGVNWTRDYAGPGTAYVGRWDAATVLVLEDEVLLGLDAVSGQVRWRLSRPEDAVSGWRAAVVSAAGDRLYLADRLGLLHAYVAAATPGTAPELSWAADVDMTGTPQLLPLPQGGVVAVVRQDGVALAGDGGRLWGRELPATPLDWLLTESGLLVSGGGGPEALWSLTELGIEIGAGPPGRLAGDGDRVYLYARDGVYLVDPAAAAAALWFPLPPGIADLGDIAVLPDGQLLVAHADSADRRLLRIDSFGRLRWQRSYETAISGAVRLLVLDGVPYLAGLTSRSAAFEVDLYRVDMTLGGLTRVFRGGTRAPAVGETWLAPAGPALLINIGGGHLVGFAPG